MMFPILLAAAGVLLQDQYSAPLEILQPMRMRLTPHLDGKLDKDEWDPFGAGTFLQWEPGKAYVAAQMAVGKDLVFSLDSGADGWLVGRDNYEFRVSVKDGKAAVRVRELDAMAVSQPVWRDLPGVESACASEATISGDVITVEAAFDDAGLRLFPSKSKPVSARLEIVDAGDPQPYLPRLCSPLQFVDFRSVALPKDLKSDVDARTRAIIPGENLKLRVTFKGSDKLGAKSIELHTIGLGETMANRMDLVFPNFDNKGRAFVDYSSKIDPASEVGYRVMRATVSFKDGPVGIVEASYRVAPFMEFRFLKSDYDRLPESNILRIPYLLDVNTFFPAEGLIRIEAPAGWQITKGDGSRFVSMGRQTSEKRTLEVKAPNDAHGTFPIKFTGTTKTKTVTQTCYVTIR